MDFNKRAKRLLKLMEKNLKKAKLPTSQYFIGQLAKAYLNQVRAGKKLDYKVVPPGFRKSVVDNLHELFASLPKDILSQIVERSLKEK